MSATTAKERVVIFDTTLRDGEQSPGISLDVGEKLEIADQLARLGVDYIEAGFPIASQGDFDAVHAIASSVRGPVICGLSRTAHKDVDRCWEAIEPAEKRRIHIFIATSPTHMEHKLRMSPAQVLDEAVSGSDRQKVLSHFYQTLAQDEEQLLKHRQVVAQAKRVLSAKSLLHSASTRGCSTWTAATGGRA